MFGVPEKNSFAARFLADQNVEAAGSLAGEDRVEALGLSQKARYGAGIQHSGKEIDPSISGFERVELESDNVVVERLVSALQTNHAPMHDRAFGHNQLSCVLHRTGDDGADGIAQR